MAVIDRRIGLLFLVFVALLSVAVLRATYLGAVRAGSLRRVAATQQVTNVPLPADRGAIVDRNGNELAISQAADDVAADPILIKNPVQVAQQLAPLLGKPQISLLAKLSDRKRGFVYLARLVPSDRIAEINRLHIDGSDDDPEDPACLSAVVGGVAGARLGRRRRSRPERARVPLRRALRGRDGTRRIVNDAIGQPISIDDVRAMQPGKTVELTIDSAFQDEVEQVLAGVGAQYSPRGATAIAMDPNTARSSPSPTGRA